MKLILASASPRRAEVLRDAGMVFQIRSAEVDESALPAESAEKMVARLAEEKARAVAAQIHILEEKCIVIGADTAVELDGKIFGKPRDAAQASQMLGALSGKTHSVLTGIFLLRLPDGASRSQVETTRVTFAPLDAAEIDAYIASGEPLDKAGAYGIQGVAGRFITRVEGCYFNVVGLPLVRLYTLVRSLGWTNEISPKP
jgi:septum formation protein